MKANKALKRLAKIEVLIADVAERYSSGASQVREALQDAVAAFARVKAAVSSQAAAGTAKKHPAKKKAASAKTAKRSAPVRKSAKKAARRDGPKKKAPAPVETLAAAAEAENIPLPPEPAEPAAGVLV